MMDLRKIILICRAIEHHFRLPRTQLDFAIGNRKSSVYGMLKPDDNFMQIEMGRSTSRGVQYHDLNEVLDTVAHEYAHYTSLCHNKAFWKCYRKYIKHIRGFFDKGYKPAFNCKEYKDGDERE